MKKLLSIIAVSLITITLHGQRNLSLTDGGSGNAGERTIPMRDVEETEDGIVVTYHFDNATIQPDPLYLDKFFVKIDAIAVFANTNESYPGLAEALTEGLFFSIWPDNGLIPQFPSFVSPSYTPMPQPVYRLGDIKNQGVMRLWDTFPNDYYHQEILHLFGDPTMYYNTEIPTSFNNVSITWEWDSISVNLGSDNATITFLDTLNNNVSSYTGSSAVFQGQTASIRLCISAHNKFPIILRGSDFDQYIQNETVNYNRTYNARNVKIGTAVTNTKPHGDVVFSGGRTVISVREVEIQGETTIDVGAELEINTR